MSWMERQVQHKHFIEYSYLTSDLIKQTFLGHSLCARHQVHGKFIRMCCQHLQTWQSWASSFPVAKETQWLFFIYSSWSFVIWSMKTNIRAVGFSQKHSMLPRASEISSTERKKTGSFEDVKFAEGTPRTVQSGAGGNGERAQECEPPHLTP